MTSHHTTHEDFGREDEHRPGSPRGFGLVFAVVFLLIALWPLTGDGGPRLWALTLAAALAIVAWLRPRLLAAPSAAWSRFGLALHRLVSPVVLALLFYAVVTPLGALMRATGGDPLRLRFDADADSYWIPRRPPGPPPETLRRQF